MDWWQLLFAPAWLALIIVVGAVATRHSRRYHVCVWNLSCVALRRK